MCLKRRDFNLRFRHLSKRQIFLFFLIFFNIAMWLHTPPSLLRDAQGITEQEVRSQQGQDGLPWGPSQAVGLIHTQSMGSQRL